MDYKIDINESFKTNFIAQLNYNTIREITFHHCAYEATVKMFSDALVCCWHIHPKIIVTPNQIINL